MEKDKSRNNDSSHENRKTDRSTAVATYREAGFVVVTPEGPKDGGDLGTYTPGTKTAGIQADLDYVKSLHTGSHREKNLYVCEGMYVTSETIRIPWLGERFRFYAVESWIDYKGTSGDAVVIDSQMNGLFKFGYVVASNSKEGWAVRIKPEDPGATASLPPDKQMRLIVLTEFHFNAIVVRGAPFPPFMKPGEVRGNGLLLDASAGLIACNRIFSTEVNTANIGIYLKGHCVSNWIDSPLVHACNTSLQIGDGKGPIEPSDNRIDISSLNDESVEGSIGARIFGERNILNLNVEQTTPYKNVVFEPEAKDNIVYASKLPNGITNNATTPTNRIISCQPVGFDVNTPPFPASGKDALNRNPYPVGIIFLTPGTVSDWTLTDAKGISQTVSATLSAGQYLMLEPGDKIRFTYKTVPTWKWRASR